jgi:hypothetical protein
MPKSLENSFQLKYTVFEAHFFLKVIKKDTDLGTGFLWTSVGLTVQTLYGKGSNCTRGKQT